MTLLTAASDLDRLVEITDADDLADAIEAAGWLVTFGRTGDDVSWGLTRLGLHVEEERLDEAAAAWSFEARYAATSRTRMAGIVTVSERVLVGGGAP